MVREDLLHLFPVAHAGDLHPQVQPLPVAGNQLLLDIVDPVFIHVQQHQPAGPAAGNLPRQLRPDASAAAGNQNILPPVPFRGFLVQNRVRVPEKQVLDVEIVEAPPSLRPGVQHGIVVYLDLVSHAVVYPVELFPLLLGQVGQGEDHLLHRQHIQLFLELALVGQNGDPADFPARLALVHVHEAHRLVYCPGIAQQLVRQHHPDASRPDDGHPDPVGDRLLVGEGVSRQNPQDSQGKLLHRAVAAPVQVDPLVGHPDHDAPQQVNGKQSHSPHNGHPLREQEPDQKEHHRGQPVGYHQPHVFRGPGVPPDLPVCSLDQPENKHAGIAHRRMQQHLLHGEPYNGAGINHKDEQGNHPENQRIKEKQLPFQLVRHRRFLQPESHCSFPFIHNILYII